MCFRRFWKYCFREKIIKACILFNFITATPGKPFKSLDVGIIALSVNPIPHRLFSNWFTIGSGRHISHHEIGIQSFFAWKDLSTWSKGKHNDFGFEGHEFKSRWHQQFSLWKNMVWVKIKHMTFGSKVTYACQ